LLFILLLQAFKCAVVPEEKLSAYKSSYSVVTSVHVYSVQKAALKVNWNV